MTAPSLSAAVAPPPRSPAVAAAPRRRVLAALAAGVALLHGVALQLLPAGSPDAAPVPPTSPRPFITRTLAPPPPPPPPPPPSVAVPAPAPAPVPVRRSKPNPAPAQAESAQAAIVSIADTPADTATVPQPPADTAPDTAPDAVPPATAPAAAGPAAPAEAVPTPPAAPLPMPPVGVPAPVLLQYDVTGFAKGLTWHASSELAWQQDGARYDLRLEIKAFLIGSRVQASTGRIDAGGLVPERFSDKARSEQAAHFDYARQRIVFSANAPEAPLLPGAQDRLGVFLQLGALLAGDPARYPAGSAIALPTVGTRDAAEWRFVVGPAETLALPAGDTTAVRLDRAPRKDFDTRVEVWYAPVLGYLPVRMRITQQSGDYVDQQLRTLGRP